MKHTVLAVTAALGLLASGSAMAQSDYYGSRITAGNGSDIESVQVVPLDRLQKQVLPGRHQDFDGRGGLSEAVRLTSATQVSFHDLNLSRRSDVAVLQARIERAAVKVCSRVNSREPGLYLAGQDEQAACVRDAFNGAMRDISG